MRTRGIKIVVEGDSANDWSARDGARLLCASLTESSIDFQMTGLIKRSQRESSMLHDGPAASFAVALRSMLTHEAPHTIDLKEGELLVRTFPLSKITHLQICSSSTLERSGVLSRYFKHNNSKSFQ